MASARGPASSHGDLPLLSLPFASAPSLPCYPKLSLYSLSQGPGQLWGQLLFCPLREPWQVFKRCKVRAAYVHACLGRYAAQRGIRSTQLAARSISRYSVHGMSYLRTKLGYTVRRSSNLAFWRHPSSKTNNATLHNGPSPGKGWT